MHRSRSKTSSRPIYEKLVFVHQAQILAQKGPSEMQFFSYMDESEFKGDEEGIWILSSI